MDSVTGLLNWAILSFNSLFQYAKDNPWESAVIFAVGYSVYWSGSYRKAKDFIRKLPGGYIILDGLFAAGKTRFLTLLSREAKDDGRFVLCNFYNKYEFVRWNSKKDLVNLLTDLWLLGEAQNCTEQELKEQYEAEGKKRVKEKIDSVRKLKRKYQNIPFNGFVSRFFIAGDEMQNIFFNRNHMDNFAGDSKALLQTLHQVRHFNALGAFALTDVSEFDVKFRKIASWYLEFGQVFGGLWLKYNVFDFETDKKHNFDIETAQKKTAVPVLSFNGYQANKIISSVERLVRRRIPFRFAQLGFFSKFNCDPTTDIYEPGTVFEKLDKWYASQPNWKKYRNPNE